MAMFMDVHTDMKGISQSDLEKAHREDAKFEAEEQVHFKSAWADPSTGHVFCLSEGPNKEAIARVHQKAGHPANEIYELSLKTDES